MRHNVTHFKSLKVGLKELEQFVRDGQHLYTGKPFKRFGNLRSRELSANWLICAVLNSEDLDEPFTFTSDPQDGDGVIYDKRAQIGWPTEHVMVPRVSPGETRDITALITHAVC